MRKMFKYKQLHIINRYLKAYSHNFLYPTTCKQFVTNNDNNNNKKKGLLDNLTDTARKVAKPLNDAMEKFGLKPGSVINPNTLDNSDHRYSSKGASDSDNSKSFTTNPQKEAQDNLQKGINSQNKNPQHGQHATYGSAGLGTSEPPYGHNTIKDYKTYKDIENLNKDTDKSFEKNSEKKSEDGIKNYGSSEAGKRSFENRGEGSSGGTQESGSMDISKNANIGAGSISSDVMGLNEDRRYPGDVPNLRKTSAFNSLHGSHGIGGTSRNLGISAGDGTSGSMYGASGTGPCTSHNSYKLFGGTSGSSGGEGFAHGNKTHNKLSRESEEIQGAFSKVESPNDKNKQETDREKVDKQK